MHSETFSQNCPLCHSKSSLLFMLEKTECLQVAKCTECELEFLEPQPSDGRLSQEYKNYYEKRKGASLHPKIQHFSELLTNLKLNLNHTKALDLGGAEGDFARAVLKMFPSCDLTVVEANTENQSYFSDLNVKMKNMWVEQFLASSSEKFHYIFLFDVLEHVRDPKLVLKQISEHLEIGGEVIASFPNSQSLSRNLLRQLWFQYKVEHLFYFSRTSIELLCRESKLEVKLLEPFYKNLPVDYLLKVASQFGPLGVQKSFRFFYRITPSIVKKRNLRAKLGEWLLRAQKR